MSIAVDGVEPRYVFVPRTVEELLDVLAVVERDGLNTLIVGRGSKLFMGNVPRRLDALIVVGGMQPAVEVDEDELVFSSSASTSYDELRRELNRHGLRWPVDPPLARFSSVGGIVASNMYGPMAYWYMTPRDQLLRVRLALVGGSMTTWGAGVIKDVAGYNVRRLVAGSMGVLGVITEVKMRAAALPEEVAVAVLDRTLDLRALRKLKPVGAVEVDGRSYMRFEGNRAEVEYRLGSMGAGDVLYGREAEELWGDLTSMAGLFSEPVVLKVVAPPANLSAAPLPQGKTFRVPMLGVAYVATGSIVGLNDLRAWASSVGGHVAVLKAPPEAKAHMDVWDIRGNRDLMARVKEAFDPRGLLGAGRYI